MPKSISLSIIFIHPWYCLSVCSFIPFFSFFNSSSQVSCLLLVCKLLLFSHDWTEPIFGPSYFTTTVLNNFYYSIKGSSSLPSDIFFQLLAFPLPSFVNMFLCQLDRSSGTWYGCCLCLRRSRVDLKDFVERLKISTPEINIPELNWRYGLWNGKERSKDTELDWVEYHCTWMSNTMNIT